MQLPLSYCWKMELTHLSLTSREELVCRLQWHHDVRHVTMGENVHNNLSVLLWPKIYCSANVSATYFFSATYTAAVWPYRRLLYGCQNILCRKINVLAQLKTDELLLLLATQDRSHVHNKQTIIIKKSLQEEIKFMSCKWFRVHCKCVSHFYIITQCGQKTYSVFFITLPQ